MGIGLDGIAKAEIKNKINKLKREIQELEQIKEKYKKMNNKIEYALQKLKSAETYKNDSFNSFKRNYSSDESNKILSEFKETMNNIDIIEKQLKNNILAESTDQISSINNKIQSKKNEIKQLERKLMRIGG